MSEMNTRNEAEKPETPAEPVEAAETAEAPKEILPAEADAPREEPAEEKPAPAKRSGGTRNGFSVPGTITKSAYESIKKYLIPPSVKIVWIAVMVLEVLTGLYGIIFEGSYLSAILMVLLCGFMVFFYFRMQNSAIRNVLKNHNELRQHGYKVVINFGNDIRLMNLTTGVERTLAFKEIYSIVETDKTILCFAKRDKVHRHMLIPKDEMTAEQRDKVMETLHSRCGTLKKRW